MNAKPPFALLLILPILLSSNLLSQSARYGKITDEERALYECPFDSSAKAIVLFDVGHFEYEFHPILTDEAKRTGEQPFTISFTRHLRIKLFDHHKLPETYLEIPAYIFPEKEKSLNTFRGMIIQGSGKEMNKRKLKRRDLSETEDEYGLVYALNLENLPAGSILDIDYRMASNYLYNIPDWTFGNKYPTLYSNMSYKIPHFIDVIKQSEISDSLTKSESTLRGHAKGIGHNSPSYSEYNTFNFIYEDYVLNNIEAIDQFDESNTMEYFIQALHMNTISSNPEPMRFYYYIPQSPEYNR